MGSGGSAVRMIYGSVLYLARDCSLNANSKIDKKTDVLSSLICNKMLPKTHPDTKLLVCDWAAGSMIAIFNWSTLTVLEIEEKFKEIPNSFLKFIFRSASRLSEVYATPFKGKENVAIDEFINFYSQVSKEFSPQILMSVLEPLLLFAENSSEGGVTFTQFVEIVKAKNSHMKDMPVEWIIEVLV